jgi:hypothetical protein
MVALAAAPGMGSLIAWLLAVSFLGPMALLSPELLPSVGASPGTLLAMGVLYLLTAACFFWWISLLVLGVKTIEDSTIGSALATLGLALLLLMGIAVGLVVVLIVLKRLF